MSAKQISRLLENSFNIGVDKDHITPVQLWHRLREFDCDERLQKKALERLTEEVARHVRCLV
jgi:hypothetical protein